jgi:hypothetical protein
MSTFNMFRLPAINQIHKYINNQNMRFNILWRIYSQGENIVNKTHEEY